MRHALYFIGMMWREERRWMLLGAAASFFALLSAIALLSLSGWFITAAGLAGLAGAGLVFDFFSPSAGIRFLALFRTATRYGERLATHDATLRFLAKLRANFFGTIANSPNVNRLRNSELLQRLTADLDAIDSLYLRLLLPAGVAFALALLVCTLFYSISAAFMIAVSAVFLAIALAVFAGTIVARKSSRRLALGFGGVRVRAIDLMQAQTDLLLSGGLAAQNSRVKTAARYLADAGIQTARIDAVTSAAISLAAAGLTLALLILGSSALERGTIGGPVMAMLVIGGFASLEVFTPLRRGAIEFGRIAFAGRRLGALSGAAPVAEQRVFVRNGPAVCLRNVTYRHGVHAEPVLRDFSLSIRRGERIALAGKSGCGKSTLLSLIAGLLEPERGEIAVRDDGSARHALGYLTQRTELFRGTIADNLRIAAPSATDAELWAALELAELAEKVRLLEGGLQWQLGETGNGFSGGECRRLALARLVLRNPAIWLLDEPTAGMDEALAQRVLENLLRHARHATVIIAAHHEREIALAGRVLRFGASAAA